jgi:hypothetical protein
MLYLTDPGFGIGIKTCVNAQALKDARPDVKATMSVYVGIPTVEGPNLRPPQGFGQVGGVTVVTS